MPFKPDLTVLQASQSLYTTLEQAGLCFGHGTDNAWDEACWLLDACLRQAGIATYQENTLVPVKVLQRMEAILEERIAEQKPLAYLLQEAWFAGSLFYVDERVLVPRSPLAELIGNDFEPLLKRRPQRILDLCTGSGCIGIAAAEQFQDAQVDLSDLSQSALVVAQENIRRFQLQKRVKTCHSDLFADLQGTYDLILSNPPYVGDEEYRSLPAEYHREPPMALLTGEQGLAIPLKILGQAADFLNEKGMLILEVGSAWQALQEALPDLPFLWLEFEYGGQGVCALSKEQLVQALG